MKIQQLFESFEQERSSSKSFQEFKNNKQKWFNPKDFNLKDRVNRINESNDLRHIYGHLFQVTKQSEFDSEFEKNPAVVVNIGIDLKQDESLWHLIDVEKTGNLGFRCYNGAVLRFGKQRAEIKMICTNPKKRNATSVQTGNNGQNPTEMNLIGMAQNNYYSNHVGIFQQSNIRMIDRKTVKKIVLDDDDDDVKKCWICLEEESEDKPFAMDICKCSQNMTRHVDCLIEWLSKKCERSKMGFITFYDFSRMVCDICKDQFPSVIQYKDKKKMFIDFDPSKINHPYMVINVYKVDDNMLKGVALVEYKKDGVSQSRRVNKNPNVITFGRNEKNDINFKGS